MKIYFHLSGRLGNQLFQWAYLHELVAQGFEIEIFVDKFHNDVNQMDLEKILKVCKHLPPIKIRNNLGNVLRIAEKLRSHGKLFEKLSSVLPIYVECLPLRKRNSFFPIIVEGYFIDKQWVVEHEGTLLSELEEALATIPDDEFLDSIKGVNLQTTAHVRRGDFKLYMDTFGLLSKYYYLNCIEETKPLLVVTDSYNEAMSMFIERPNTTLVDPKNYDVWTALKILARSDRLIMSNSTLAWWGGFMAHNLNNAQVIMPKPIYVKPSEFDEKLALRGFTLAQSIFE